jgi:hypothetical protein
MCGSHLFLQVEAGRKIPPAFPFWRPVLNEWLPPLPLHPLPR